MIKSTIRQCKDCKLRLFIEYDDLKEIKCKRCNGKMLINYEEKDKK